ncbi:DUF7178 family protein [Streptomyces hydrogenans]|uniref:Uncharacterized protein n=1 Tax=Streptomyces hydrogenans TaxID=1873719 RepID=A0ABQ3PJM6_9ACTN|nr:hypothetical protein [Streptomyces hydrogenans]GHG09898.1 hypothetical protein GCM10018784_23180 [Streptomyces hydrogenans]GHI25230.1 hypothetical protein Shyd_66010 [Streptomyces hydrogenans]
MIPVNPSDSTRRRYVRNIVKVYRQATEDQEARGKSWYRTAHQLADMMSGGNVIAGAGVIAALSANKAWDMNRRLAHDAFAGRVHGHTGDALGKVVKIMSGVDPAEVLPMGIKTGNFYRCILDPDDAEAVCVDRHAHDIAYGSPQGNRDRGLSSKGRYAALSLAYRNAAAILGVLPSQVQAVTWVVWTESLAGVKRRPTLERYSHDQ